jgi:hypothetical protein
MKPFETILCIVIYFYVINVNNFFLICDILYTCTLQLCVHVSCVYMTVSHGTEEHNDHVNLLFVKAKKFLFSLIPLPEVCHDDMQDLR